MGSHAVANEAWHRTAVAVASPLRSNESIGGLTEWPRNGSADRRARLGKFRKGRAKLRLEMAGLEIFQTSPPRSE
jgi:hypothetical protein